MPRAVDVSRHRTPNAKGRNDTESYIKIGRGVYDSEAWRALSCEARCLVLLVWSRHNGYNNGSIPLSRREAREHLRIGTAKLRQAFTDAQERGFLVARVRSTFDWKTGANKGRAREWEITTEPCDGKPAKRLYKNKPRELLQCHSGTTAVPVAAKSGQKHPERNYSGATLGHFKAMSGTTVVPLILYQGGGEK